MKLLLCIIISLAATFSSVAQQWQFPEIQRAGGVYSDIPGRSFKADKNLKYKVVIEIDNSDTISTKVSNSIEVASRFINLLAVDGITKEKRSVVIIFHNAGSYSIQKDEVYQRKYGKANPNLDALQQLQRSGVQLYICGQSTIRRKISPDEIIPDVVIATSFLTTYVAYQLKGYATLKM